MIGITSMTVGAENNKMWLVREAGCLVIFRRFYYCSLRPLCFMVFITHLIGCYSSWRMMGSGNWHMRRQKGVTFYHSLTISSTNHLRSGMEEYYYFTRAIICWIYSLTNPFILSILPTPFIHHFNHQIIFLKQYTELKKGNPIFLLKWHPVVFMHPLSFLLLSVSQVLQTNSPCSFLPPPSSVACRLRRK